ncbi:hypothetical protein QBC46DRAFT_380692 [Diplogelasinospora grovesii]|uniref:Small ribosomal subunit protein uS11m n=1 Tax=Diplogelasinospora grovesii TaxID=303347 RepID=A0AAN6S6Z0_9PEZI|nr:hypothetical protein QBC46DRAFT_380692 [Diplogelasinospora grovesii]
MSRSLTSRLLARDLFRPVSQTPRVAPSIPQWSRAFSQSHAARQDKPASQQATATPKSNPMEMLARSVMSNAADPTNRNDAESLANNLGMGEDQGDEPYHFHVYSHKHNTHITVSKPNRDAIISLSCGNLGFKKSARKHYDSAYQLGAYVIDKLHQQGIVKKIHKLEVILRGFGAGREAVTKVLLGNEGKMLRGKITRVADATRLKFGGTRSKKPRRLG